jgi:hypothetical protein
MVAASTQGAAPGVQEDCAPDDLITPSSHGCLIIPAITYPAFLCFRGLLLSLLKASPL